MKPGNYITYKRRENIELEIEWYETALELLPEGELRDKVQADLMRLRSSLSVRQLTRGRS
jgi:hypothetical protein